METTRFRPRPRLPGWFLLLAAAALAPFPASAEPGGLPLPSLPSSSTRSAILRSAESLLGTPYRFGGEDEDGLDCSGLVFLVFGEATGRSIPRTVAEQRRWVLVIPKRELKPGDLVFFSMLPRAGAAPAASADHVGIYEGDGNFLHAASAGSPSGVVRNSLDEAAWSRRFLFAGRAVPASALSGAAFEWGLAVLLDAETAGGISGDGALFGEILRGAGFRLAATFPLARNFSTGIQCRIEWDALLDVARIPLELVLGQNSGFSIFAGPALTLGSPRIPAAETGSADRSYEAIGGWIASAGLRWSPLVLRSGASVSGPFAEIRFDRFLPIPGQAEDVAADRRATITFAIGLRFRNVRY